MNYFQFQISLTYYFTYSGVIFPYVFLYYHMIKTQYVCRKKYGLSFKIQNYSMIYQLEMYFSKQEEG
jgi:hypothetical protein